MTTATVTRWEQFLSDRFDNQDEINDIVRYGMSQGVGGFIYSTELYEIFEEHEDAIWSMLEDAGLFFSDFIKDKERWSMQEVREPAVWAAVELWCHNQANK